MTTPATPAQMVEDDVQKQKLAHKQGYAEELRERLQAAAQDEDAESISLAAGSSVIMGDSPNAHATAEPE